jgi:hypothetical protein
VGRRRVPGQLWWLLVLEHWLESKGEAGAGVGGGGM